MVANSVRKRADGVKRLRNREMWGMQQKKNIMSYLKPNQVFGELCRIKMEMRAQMKIGSMFGKCASMFVCNISLPCIIGVRFKRELVGGFKI